MVICLQFWITILVVLKSKDDFMIWIVLDSQWVQWHFIYTLPVHLGTKTSFERDPLEKQLVIETIKCHVITEPEIDYVNQGKTHFVRDQFIRFKVMPKWQYFFSVGKEERVFKRCWLFYLSKLVVLSDNFMISRRKKTIKIVKCSLMIELNSDII